MVNEVVLTSSLNLKIAVLKLEIEVGIIWFDSVKLLNQRIFLGEVETQFDFGKSSFDKIPLLSHL